MDEILCAISFSRSIDTKIHLSVGKCKRRLKFLFKNILFSHFICNVIESSVYLVSMC